MENELDLLMRARHPHVLRYVHHVSVPDTLQIFTELCEGRDLAQRMKEWFDKRRYVATRLLFNLLLACRWYCHYLTSANMFKIPLGTFRMECSPLTRFCAFMVSLWFET